MRLPRIIDVAFFFCISLHLSQALDKQQNMPNGKDVAHEQHIHHHLPPAAIPGIAKQFDSALRRKRMLVPETRNLMSHYQGPLFVHKVRRFPGPSKHLKRKKRDLRRLRRELGYHLSQLENRPELSLLGNRPAHEYSYSRGDGRPSSNGRGKALDRLMQRINILENLEKLAYGEGLSHSAPDDVPGIFIHPPHSRFAPQPKVFSDDEVFSKTNHLATTFKNQGKEKRRPRVRSMANLPLLPGFKRSAQENMQPIMKRAKWIDKDQQKNGIRTTAM